VEPFDFLLKQFDPSKEIDFNSLFFNSSEKYIHVNKNEQIALSREDLLSGKFFSKGLENLDSISEIVFQENEKNKLKVFKEDSKCAYCKAFKICLGKFIKDCEKGNKPVEFFEEVFDAVANK
jgi:radical SAM protein with 4Fe4S-binding SPASM domain